MSDEVPNALRQRFEPEFPTFGSNSEDVLPHTEYITNACAKRIGVPSLPHFACRKELLGAFILTCRQAKRGRGDLRLGNLQLYQRIDTQLDLCKTTRLFRDPYLAMRKGCHVPALPSRQATT